MGEQTEVQQEKLWERRKRRGVIPRWGGWGRNRWPKLEDDFYRLSLPLFQGNRGQEADNYQFIRWSAFARYWNKVVDEQVAGIRTDTGMTYKSVHMLQEYHKKFKKDANAAATLAPVYSQNRDMRRELRGPDRETAVVFDAAPAKMSICKPSSGVKRASLEASHPFESKNDDECNFPVDSENDEDANVFQNNGDYGDECEEPPKKQRALVLPFGGTYPAEAETLEEMYQAQPVQELPKKRKRQKRRCPKCGHTNEWVLYIQRHPKMDSATGATPAMVCVATADEVCEGFPVKNGRRLNSIKRYKYNNGL